MGSDDSQSKVFEESCQLRELIMYLDAVALSLGSHAQRSCFRRLHDLYPVKLPQYGLWSYISAIKLYKHSK
jgi:hypothetical protein